MGSAFPKSALASCLALDSVVHVTGLIYSYFGTVMGNCEQNAPRQNANIKSEDATR